MMEQSGEDQRSRRASRAWLLTAAGGLLPSPDAEEEHRRLRARAAGPPLGRQPSASPPPPQLSASPRVLAGSGCFGVAGEPQPVVRLSCASCGEALSERGLCVQLVLDPDTKLFSTDTRPGGIVEQGPVGVVPGQCLCRIQDFACGCGLRVGYHLAQPCKACGPRQDAHSHRWFFSARCVRAEPLRSPARQPLAWPARHPSVLADSGDENQPPAGAVPALPALRAPGLEGKAFGGASFWPLAEANGRRGPEEPLEIGGPAIKEGQARLAETSLLASRAAAADAEARAAEAAAAGAAAERRAAEAEAARAGALRAAAAAEARAAEAEAARAAAEARLAQEVPAPRADEAAARAAEDAAGLRPEVEELRARVAALQAQLARPSGDEGWGSCAGGGAAAAAAFEEARLLCAQRLSEKREALSRWEQALARREAAVAARERAVEAPAAGCWSQRQLPAGARGCDGGGVPPQPCGGPRQPRGAAACASGVPAACAAHGWLAGARRRFGCGSRHTPAARAAEAAAWMAATQQGGL